MKFVTKLNQRGIHLWVLSLVIISVAAAGFALDRVNNAEAASKRITRKEKVKYAQAAEAYWKDKLNYDEVHCKPYQVRNIYKNLPEHTLAESKLVGAWNDTGKKGKHYCKIYWNKKKLTGDRVTECMIFVHEYGHLLGAVHNNHKNSIMYSGFHNYYKWEKKHEHITICNQVLHPNS